MAFAKEYTNQELMASVCARFIRDYEYVFLGVGVPVLAGSVAIKTHAPNAVIVYEAGGIGPISRRIPRTVSDSPTTENALGATELWRVLGDMQRGFIDLAILGGAQIDKYGNLNSTVITGKEGSYEQPRVRLAGSGGANDAASSAKRVLIAAQLREGRFVEKLDFLTSPGYLGGPGEREKAGLRGRGPEAVITDKCVFRFDPSTKEMFLSELFPGITAEEVKAAVGWELKVAPELKEVSPPTEEEVRIMRAIDPIGIILGGRSFREAGSFEDYYERTKRGYESVIPLIIWDE